MCVWYSKQHFYFGMLHKICNEDHIPSHFNNALRPILHDIYLFWDESHPVIYLLIHSHEKLPTKTNVQWRVTDTCPLEVEEKGLSGWVDTCQNLTHSNGEHWLLSSRKWSLERPNFQEPRGWFFFCFAFYQEYYFSFIHRLHHGVSVSCDFCLLERKESVEDDTIS